MKEFAQVKSFARIESACVFSFGLLFLIHSISQIKHSSLPWHFFMTLKFFIKLSGIKSCTPLINQQSVVYEFTRDLCDTNYIGYTCRHLRQRVEEHKLSVIGKHFRDVHDLIPDNLIKNFKVIKKCRGKLECLIYEMLWIKNKRPKLNTQADSIRAKLFT